MIKDIVERKYKMILSKIREFLKELRGGNRELLWAQIWNDTRRGIEWLGDDFGVSPGRWAVGYDYIYVMTRVLEEIRPHKVLDIGLGISTSLISEYFDYYKYVDGEHIVVEHDSRWVEVYTNRHKLSNSTIIKQRKLVKKNQCYMYDNFSDLVYGKIFNVISIDGPFGGTGRYSRIDILTQIPSILDNEFVIVMDDMQRLGEQNTFAEVQSILKQHGIAYAAGIYAGEKAVGVIVSANNKFICTM